MRSLKQTPSELNGDHVDDAPKKTDAAADDAVSLAEAEAAEAEAVAAAARARAKALRMRREADAAKATESATETTIDEPVDEDDVDDEDEKDTVADETAVDDAEEIETAQEAEAVDEPARARRRRRVPLPSWKVVAGTVAVVLIAALLAGSGYMYWFHRQVQAEQQRRAEFAAAARQGVVTLMSLNFKQAKEDVQRIVDNSTGQFKTDFESTAEDFVKVAMSRRRSPTPTSTRRPSSR